MSFLIDTSVLVRLANASDAQHGEAVRAVLELHRRGERLQLTAQVLIEFRNVATRPKAMNGAGLPIVDAEAHASAFEARFPLLAETPDVYPARKTLVSTLAVIGKQVHDARLAAVCHVHGVSHLLTFNVSHFNRMATFDPGLVVIDPATV